MTPLPTQHFTADDLDAFHSEALSREVRLHLETCEDCRRLVAADRHLVTELSRLPAYEPHQGFTDRVMARVAISESGPVPVLSYPRLTRRRVAALSALAAGIVFSVAWSAANRTILDGWLTGIGSSLFETGSGVYQALVKTLAAQPWYESVRQVGANPLRFALLFAATIALYGSALLVLRRLITPSGRTVSNAGI